MKNWIKQRSRWMSDNIGSSSVCSDVELPKLVITKIHYHPEENDFDENDQEFIEIMNNGNLVVSARGLYFQGTGFVFQFDAGTTIEAGEKIVIANDAETYRRLYGKNPLGEYSRALSNKSQTLKLSDAFGNVIDEVHYTDSLPWPEKADGDGFYLSLKNPDLDNADPANWEAIEVTFNPSGALHATNPHPSFFPNPTQGFLHVNSQKPITKIIVLSISGKKVISQEVQALKTTIELASLRPAIYLVRLEMADGQSTVYPIVKE